MPELPAVRKAVIPAAGLGTRFLPATKAIPKEMLPVVDKPAIQYVIEEAVRAGIRDILVVTGRTKRAIADHFDRSFELEQELAGRGKTRELDEVRAIAELADIHYVRQGQPLGLGHAVGVARRHVGDEPFAVLLPDDPMGEGSTVLADMLEASARHQASVVALKEVARDEIRSYGAAAPEGDPTEDGLVRLAGIVEKPAPEDAPSNLAVMGRYVFTPAIFDALDEIPPGAGGELQLTDAIALLLGREPVFGLPFSKGRYDTGNKLDYLRAVVEFALDRPDLGPGFGAYLAEAVRTRGLA